MQRYYNYFNLIYICCGSFWLKAQNRIGDLLGQQSNYERWVNATGRSDTQYNSVNSYAMLHVRYRLNIFGGKIDTEGRYDKKWGSRDNNRGGGWRR